MKTVKIPANVAKALRLQTITSKPYKQVYDNVFTKKVHSDIIKIAKKAGKLITPIIYSNFKKNIHFYIRTKKRPQDFLSKSLRDKIKEDPNYLGGWRIEVIYDTKMKPLLTEKDLQYLEMPGINFRDEEFKNDDVWEINVELYKPEARM